MKIAKTLLTLALIDLSVGLLNWSCQSPPSGMTFQTALQTVVVSIPTFTPTSTATATNPTVTFTPTITFTPVPTNIYCSSDNVTGVNPTGKFVINNSSSIVPLCDGWFLYGDRSTNKIVTANVVAGVVGTSYTLGAMPGDLVYDPLTGLLFATLASANSLAKVDLNTAAVSNIPLSAPAAHMAVGNSGLLFATLLTSPVTLAVLDGVAGLPITELAVPATSSPALVGYDKNNDYIYFANEGGSGGYTYQYTFNAGTTSIGSQVTSLTSNSNGHELNVSNDGAHVVVPAGGGNGSGYVITDFDATNIANTLGSFSTGSYPTAGDFSPDSANFTASNGTDLFVFGVASHATSKTTWTGASSSGIGMLIHTHFSKGGSLVLGLDSDTSSTSQPSTVIWETFP